MGWAHFHLHYYLDRSTKHFDPACVQKVFKMFRHFRKQSKMYLKNSGVHYNFYNIMGKKWKF